MNSQEKIQALLDEVEAWKETARDGQRNISRLMNEIAAIKVSSPPLRVSDHVVLRFAERMLGLDTNQIKEKIIEKASPYASLGDGKFPLADGQVIIKDGVVVTYIQ